MMHNQDMESTPLLQPTTSVHPQYVQPQYHPVPIAQPQQQQQQQSAPFKLSYLQRCAVTTFAIVRTLRGLCFFVWPALGLSSFDIPESGATFLLGSLIGSRDLLLGGLLWTADQRSRRETSRAVLASLLGDALDTCILIFSAACSWHWRNPVIEIICLAVLAIAEHLTLFSMSEDDYVDGQGGGAAAYVAGLQAAEDKNRRMDAWLAEMRLAEAAQQLSMQRDQTPTPTFYQQQRQDALLAQQQSYYYRPASTIAPPGSSIAPESCA